MQHDLITSAEGRLLGTIIESQGSRLDHIDNTLQRVAQILEALGRLEERQAESNRNMATALSMLKEHDNRIKVVEVEVPSLKEVRRWTITGVLALVGTFVLGLINGTVQIASKIGHP